MSKSRKKKSPAELGSTPSRKEANRLRKQRQRDRQRLTRMAAATERRLRQEESDERQAPKVQREDVISPARKILSHGVEITLPETMIRAARVVSDGDGFRRADPLTHIASEIDGGSQMFSMAHYACGRRLRDAWDAAGDGVGLGPPDLLNGHGASGKALTTPPGHDCLLDQVNQRLEIEAAATFLGALWPAIRDMVLVGKSVAAWALSSHIDHRAAPGYLRAGLDRLVEFYAPRAENPHSPQMIRVIAPARESYSTEIEPIEA